MAIDWEGIFRDGAEKEIRRKAIDAGTYEAVVGKASFARTHKGGTVVIVPFRAIYCLKGKRQGALVPALIVIDEYPMYEAAPQNRFLGNMINLGLTPAYFMDKATTEQDTIRKLNGLHCTIGVTLVETQRGRHNRVFVYPPERPDDTGNVNEPEPVPEVLDGLVKPGDEKPTDFFDDLPPEEGPPIPPPPPAPAA